MENKRTKTTLEKSKARLADAFNRLEAVLDSHLFNSNCDNEALELKSQLEKISKEKEHLTINLNEISTDYNKIKTLSKEALEDLTTSINTIQNIINSHGDSRHKDSK